MNKYLAKYLLYYPTTLFRGERIAKHLQACEKFQWAGPEIIAAHQLSALQKLLDYVYHNSRYYRRSFDQVGLHPNDVQSLDDLGKLPFVEKEQLTTIYEDTTSGRNALLSVHKTTGGSTGQAVTVRKNPDALARERAASWRSFRWAGVDIGDPQARFWGVPFARRRRLTARVSDIVANRVRLSAFGINEEGLHRYYRRLRKFNPTYFYGYVSIIKEFAAFVEKQNFAFSPSLRAIITTSEVLDAKSRQYLEDVFRCRVYDEYGCGEVGVIGQECEYGSMHIMAENLIVETIADASASGDAGEIVVTDLFNYAMPLIRYRLRDYGILSGDVCSCERRLPVIRKIYGRAYDMIIDKNGKKYHPEIIMYIFEELKDRYGTIRQFQVTQRNKNVLEVVIVPTAQYDPDTETVIRSMIRDKIDASFDVLVSYEAQIYRERSGKIRLVKSELRNDS